MVVYWIAGRGIKKLTEFGYFHGVHVAIVFVFAGHAPDKGVITGTTSGMNRPGRRNNSLVVMHQQVPGFLRLAHKMNYCLAFPHIKIKVRFHAAVVGMGRHGVPNAAGCQYG